MTSLIEGKVLIVDDEKLIRDIISLMIGPYLNGEILEAASGPEAVEILKKDLSAIQLIISDFYMPDGNGDVLYQYMKDHNLTIPFILCSSSRPFDKKPFTEFESERKSNLFLQKPFDFDGFLDDIFKVLGKFKAGEEDVVDEKFLRFNAKLLVKYFNMKEKLDIYIRLPRGKMVKIVDAANIGTEKETLEHFHEKGIKEFFLVKDSFKLCVENILSNLKEQFQEFDNYTPGAAEKKLDLVFDSVDGIRSALKVLGVSDDVIELIDNVVDATEGLIGEEASLGKLLTQIRAREGYIKNHGYLTAYLACAMIDQWDWKPEGIGHILIMASLFQNITLDKDELAAISSWESVEFSSLTQEQQDEVLKHPLKAGELLGGKSGPYSQIGRFIEISHERPDGTGFPKGLKADDIDEVEALFILAVSFAHELMEKGTLGDVPVLATDFKDLYNSGTFQKAYAAFLQTFSQVKFY